MLDEMIITMFWDRDETALTETSKKYGTYCYSIAWNILHNHKDTEECVNDTWLRAWNAIPPQRPARLRHFLARITRNLALDNYKKQRAEKRGGEMIIILSELAECIADTSNVEDVVFAKKLKAFIGEFVSKLPAREGNIFIRRYFYAEPLEEIADRYRISSNYVAVILNRTRIKLKKCLRKEGYIS